MILTISANVSAEAVAAFKIASILAFSVDTKAANEVSPDVLAVISADNTVSNESTDADNRVSAVALVTSSFEILVCKEVSAVALVASSVETLVVKEVSAVVLAVISPLKPNSN